MDIWTPTSVELFRISGVTFNAHRIHYDLPYAMEAEQYPGLVVHGPLTALRLCAVAERVVGPLKTLRFRAEAPLFAGFLVRLNATAEGAECHTVAERCDGTVAMKAIAEF